ncbi:cupin domain-containing protein [Geminicoccus roseus]|uniref:cupin domain-containing protein n=1 Tax=Geminicoccus roseus TaxID=404900 RepID=UPI0003FB1129|nr:cupin domain-containing protein [Geminicoccus roseus]
MSGSPLATSMIAAAPDTLAPDGSEIRFLPQLRGGSMVHCRVPVGTTTKAVRHKTVEELWYVLDGVGEIWRRMDGEEKIDPLVAGTAVTIPLHVHFQFRNTGTVPLDIVIVTMPPWPSMDEAEPVPDRWTPSPGAPAAT